MDQVLFQNYQSTSQIFVHFGWVYLPTNPFFSQARWTGLFGPVSPPPCHFDFVARVPTFPWYHAQSGRGGEGLFLYSIILLFFVYSALYVDISSFLCTQYKNLPMLTILDNGETSWRSGETVY